LIRPVAERRVLERAAASGKGDAGLARAAVLLARVECPDADPDRVESILEGFAAELRRRGPGAATAPSRARVLAGLLAGERGLRGNHAAYDDPRNSCLECVLDRRLGIPLTLSLAWMEAGRRAGWRVEGVGLPGHFVVRVRGDAGDAVLADPFHGGGVVGTADLRQHLRSLHGRPVRLGPRDLEPVGPRDLLLRMLRNLRGCYRKRGERAKGLAVAEDMLLLCPALPEALRDRGLLRLEGGDRAAGLADLRAFLDTGPAGPGAAAVHRLVSVVTDDAEMPN
jgi:regulator of sirC expression with transglutaminase-like and TPR domain